MSQVVNSNERRVFSAACLFAAITPLICWVLIVGGGEIPIWIPFISDLPLFEPAATIFPIGMTTSALLFVMVVPAFHRKFRDKVEGNERLRWAPAFTSGLLFLASLALVIVSHFNWIESPILHFTAACLLFAFLVGWGLVASHLGKTESFENKTRQITVLLGTGLFIALTIFTVFVQALPLSASDVNFSARPYLVIVAAGLEWMLMLNLSVMMWTWRHEL